MEIKLPRTVGEEIDYGKSIKDVTFDDYIWRELVCSNYDQSATKRFVNEGDGNSLETLLNAWNSSWEEE